MAKSFEFWIPTRRTVVVPRGLEELMIDPREALVHIRTLVRATDDIDDPELLRRHLKEIAGIIDNALRSDATPNQMYPRQRPTRRN